VVLQEQTAPAWVPQGLQLLPGATRSQLLYGLLSMGCSFIQGMSTCVGSSTGCSVHICSTVVFSLGCRGISTLAPAAPPPHPSPLTLVSAGLFLSHFSLSSHSYCAAFFTLTYVFRDAAILARGSALSCGRSIGAGCIQYRAAQTLLHKPPLINWR